MLGAPLGGRGVVVVVDDAAQPPSPLPAGSAGVAAMVMGATTHGLSAAHFNPNSTHVIALEKVTQMVGMVHPHRL